MAVSDREKNPEKASNTISAAICADKGMSSKRGYAGNGVK